MGKQIFSIALDGPSGAGKSTVAKDVAKRLDILYLDTGALYRAIGVFVMDRDVALDDEEGITRVLPAAVVSVRHEGGQQRTYLDGQDVSERVRTPEGSLAASMVSKVAAVRARLVEMQREIASGLSIIMDGRDIGTKVLPSATLKIFLVASPEVRARRRYDELTAKGTGVSYEQVLREMIERDHQDSTRAISPLRQAEDAVLIDSDGLTAEEVADEIIKLLKEKIQ